MKSLKAQQSERLEKTKQLAEDAIKADQYSLSMEGEEIHPLVSSEEANNVPLGDAFPWPSAATTTAVAVIEPWSTSDASTLYGIDKWGSPYFGVNSSGNMSVHPNSNGNPPELDIFKILKTATYPIAKGGFGLQLPLILRFPDMLRNRLHCLVSAFENAIADLVYRASYQGVYPVKCNQDMSIVKDIVNFGFESRFGLEAGSKPELLLAMSCLCNGHPDSFLVCNGFKDAEYISLALFAKKLNLNTVIVLEQEQELDLVIKLSNEMEIEPVIGVRAKLRTQHSGHFGATSGENGKFGLTATQILRVVKRLKQVGMLQYLKVLHFHIGSQIRSTDLVDAGVREATRIYCELVRLEAPMNIIDVGGGLGIDYDGSKSDNSDASVSYGLKEYAEAVVKAIQSVCDTNNVEHPVICSESGRAIVSHHSVLIFNAVSSPKPSTLNLTDTDLNEGDLLKLNVGDLSKEARSDYRYLMAAAKGEKDRCLFYADKLKKRCFEDFKEGTLNIEQLVIVDGFCERVTKEIGSEEIVTYNANLSVFTSIPDSWGIKQLFPIVPIHKLDEKPGVEGVLSDLTCDSDGKIDKFIGGKSSLPLHEMNSGPGDYYLGMLLAGAYQEALGGYHNLFGRPNVLRVSVGDDPNNPVLVYDSQPGLSCADVLGVMHHESKVMLQTLKKRAADAGESDSERTRLENSFESMPYLVVGLGSGASSSGTADPSIDNASLVSEDEQEQ